MKTIYFVLVFFVLSTFLYSTIINVPADQPTIQEGIDVSVDSDTVLVQPGTYVENINYNGKMITVASLFLTTQDTTYISQTVIDGNQSGSVVKFESGEGSSTLLTGFTITNGSATSGGGIYCSDSSPSLMDITITGNSAFGQAYAFSFGGGIFCENSSPSLVNVTITENSSLGTVMSFGIGGGIYCDYNSSPSIVNVIVSGNYADSGGGIYCEDSSPSLDNVTITGNIANSYGGGISCEDSSPSLVDVIISGNSAVGPGGGISCNNSNPILQNVTIMGNTTSAEGGGIYCVVSSPILQNVTITGNYAHHGGGIYCIYDSSPSLVDITISGNSANEYNEYDGYGGGIYCDDSSPSLVNVTISGNYAYGIGGGIYCHNNSSPSMESVAITGNVADDHGGGIYCNNNSSPSFSVNNRCNIYSNTIENARGFGADLFAEECNTIHIIVDTFTVMPPTDYYASPINNFIFDILHSVIDSLINADVYVSVDGDNSNSGTSPDLPFKTINHALEKIRADSLNINTIHLAPGVYSNSTNGEIFPIFWSNYVNLSGNSEDDTILDAESTSSVMVFNFVTDTIISNITITNGYSGGISCNNSSPSLVNVTITGNSAVYNGGGISCDNSSPSLINVTITDNYSTNSGGGIYCNSSSPSLENVTISDNTSTWYYGGGIYCRVNSNPSLVNVTITSNFANYGGGIFCHDSSPSLVNVTMLDNSAGSNGGGVYFYESNPSLVNCILWNNLPQEIIFNYGSVTVTYSDIQGGWEGEGNIDEDPLFVGTGEHPLMLQDLSPCVNAGIPDTTGLNLPEFDLAGNPRVYGGRIDMGAYENQNVIVGADEDLIPLITKLNQNYPNPFNPETTINYSLKEDSKVSLNIYNIKGQKVNQLVSDQLSIGQHSVIWNGKDNNGKSVSSGIYFYKLKTENYEKTKKMILLK